MGEDSFSFINPDGRSDILFLCEHAGNAMPAAYQGRIEEGLLEQHFAYDIGAAQVVKRLSALLNAPAILGRYTRLLVDLNRPAGSDLLFPDIGDTHPIVMNQNMDNDEKIKRIDTYFTPYHHAIEAHLERCLAHSALPMVISVHSFTPSFHDFHRPWHLGLTWIHDDRLSQLMRNGLIEKGMHVGMHEPYNSQMLRDMSLESHADKRCLPNAFLEIRNDQIRDQAGQERMAEILCDVIAKHLGRQDIHSLYNGPQCPRDLDAENSYIKTNLKTRVEHIAGES